MVALSSPAPSRLRANRMIVTLPLIAAACIAVALALAVMIGLAADAQQRAAEERAIARVFQRWQVQHRDTVEQLMRGLAEDATPAASDAQLVRDLKPRLLNARGLGNSSGFLLRNGNVSLLSLPFSTDIRLNGVEAMALVRAAGQQGAIMAVRDMPFLALARPLRSGATPGNDAEPILLWLRPVNDSELITMAFQNGHDLAVVSQPGPRGNRHVAVTSPDGAVLAHLEAQSASLVSALGPYVLPVLLLALLALGFSVKHAIDHNRNMQAMVSEIEGRAFDLAMRDPLTGLPNRSSFRKRLETAIAARKGNALVGVIYVDLDRFKEVNDGFGHKMGDDLLVAVTDRLRALADKGLTVSRLGGDEFALLVEGVASAEKIVDVGVKASAAMGQPFLLGATEVSIGGSVGISIAPQDGVDPGELVRRADVAMYRAKLGGRGQALRFDPSMDNDVKRRKAIELDLRKAVERNELFLMYQPFWAADGETLVGVEALVRWKHPLEGMISPGFFIPIAEETGLIHPLGDWIVNQAMADAARWPDLRLAINLSPMQFRRPGLFERFKAQVEAAGFDPRRLEIEITEGVLMEDPDSTVMILRAFRDLGIHIALDDFGTGYSSLSYLRRFPFDKLKVDQSFVRNLSSGPGTAAIVHSVVSLGRSLGLIVHAEGVEALEHHVFLRAAGCHHLQGYYFARPMLAEGITQLINARAEAGDLPPRVRYG
jgi:diguanylate cyclase (GGDEF)-like protein